jgi:hypothetical protein
MQTRGRFDFRLDYFGTTSFGQILLANHFILPTGELSITPQLTELEVETHIQLLREDLDAVAERMRREMYKREARFGHGIPNDVIAALQTGRRSVRQRYCDC